MRQNKNSFRRFDYELRQFLITSLLFLLAAGCASRPDVGPSRPAVAQERGLARIGYAIQVGAFSNLNNAVRLAQTLQDRGLNAYYFVHKTGLFKVRFGNFPSKESAREKAENLRVVARTYLRNEIVRTSEGFIGVPYRWGGASPKYGFDCSGLSMAVYQLNGLDLPITSNEQWVAGSPVRRSQLSKADLVFFATRGRKKISHVGIYVGQGQFIHASGMGKKIRIDSLSDRYYRRRYVGARTYL